MRKVRTVFCLLIIGLGLAACEALDSDEPYQRPSADDGLDPAYGGGHGIGRMKSGY